MEITKAIAQEIELQRKYLTGEEIETIYFGGGTPSLLAEQELQLIFNAINSNFSLTKTPEITLEANPEDLSTKNLLFLKSLGVNRLSIGIQSFDDSVLKFINRSHNSATAKEAVFLARKIGFDNISIDLIYAIPGRETGLLATDLDQLLQLKPEHISAYSLTIEDNTAFGKRRASKKFIDMSDEGNAQQFEMVMDSLTSSGYDHYEISNYSKPGFISNHNSHYWKGKKYLGIGPSAHSFDGTSRQSNIANNYSYLRSIQSKVVPSTKEILSRENQINEFIMTSLRTSWGCDLQHLKALHQFDLLVQQEGYIGQLADCGLIRIEKDILYLTREGKMVADKISSDLFLDA